MGVALGPCRRACTICTGLGRRQRGTGALLHVPAAFCLTPPSVHARFPTTVPGFVSAPEMHAPFRTLSRSGHALMPNTPLLSIVKPHVSSPWGPSGPYSGSPAGLPEVDPPCTSRQPRKGKGAGSPSRDTAAHRGQALSTGVIPSRVALTLIGLQQFATGAPPCPAAR